MGESVNRKERSFLTTVGRGAVRGRAAWLSSAVALVFLLGGLQAAVGATEEDRVVSKFVGKNWVNGRSWEKLDYSGKLGFVCGLFDGMTVFYSMADSEKSIKKGVLNPVYNALSIPSQLTVGDVVDGMDEFYKDPENLKLPAICAYLHFVAVSRSEKLPSLQKRVIIWRRMFTD